jgi:hypothetical protein
MYLKPHLKQDMRQYLHVIYQYVSAQECAYVRHITHASAPNTDLLVASEAIRLLAGKKDKGLLELQRQRSQPYTTISKQPFKCLSARVRHNQRP